MQSHFWTMQLQIASRFSDKNRVFLVGDSAYAFVAAGGFGLNTGMGDATNLGFKLAAVIKGNTSPDLLKSYEAERRPVCLNNLNLAAQNAKALMTLRTKYPPQKNPERFAKGNIELAQQYVHVLSATLGYGYAPTSKKQQTVGVDREPYQPKLAVGYFLPHVWVEPHIAIYDQLSLTLRTGLVNKSYFLTPALRSDSPV